MISTLSPHQPRHWENSFRWKIRNDFTQRRGENWFLVYSWKCWNFIVATIQLAAGAPYVIFCELFFYIFFSAVSFLEFHVLSFWVKLKINKECLSSTTEFVRRSATNDCFLMEHNASDARWKHKLESMEVCLKWSETIIQWAFVTTTTTQQQRAKRWKAEARSRDDEATRKTFDKRAAQMSSKSLANDRFREMR